MKKINILYSIPNFDSAGSGKVLYDLAKSLNDDHFKVQIICNNKNGIFFNEVEKLNKPIHILEFTQPLRPYISLPFRMMYLVKFYKKNNIDIVHSWHWSSDWSEVLACKIARVKYVYTKKAMTWGNIHWKIRSFLSDFIITLNQDMKNYFPWKKNQELIPLGLDIEAFNPVLFKKENTNKFTIITVANLVPVKGIEILIEAINKLNNPNIELNIVGDNSTEYAKQLNDLISKHKLDKQINFLGKHNDIRSYLVSSDLYVIPSYKEGMPMALVEAMGMGLPVLGSNVQGVNYVLKDHRELLFTSGDYNSLSEKINQMMILKKEELEKIGQSLREYVIENFSNKKFIEKHEILYKSLKN